MRAFFQGLIFLVLIFLALPFLIGFIIQSGGYEYYLSVISGVLLLTGILLLIRARTSQGLLLLLLSIIVYMNSKGMIGLNGMNNIFYSSYYFGGSNIPAWLVLLIGITVIILLVRRS